MSFALLTHTQASGSSAAVITAPIDTTGADLLIAVIHGNFQSGSTDPFMYTDTYGNTANWVYLTQYKSPGTNGTLTRILYCLSPAVGTGHVFEVHGSDSYPTVDILAYSGVGVTPFDGDVGNSNASSVSSIQPGSLTPSQAGDLLISAATWSVAGTYTSDIGTIIDQTTGGGTSMPGVVVAYVQGGAAAFNPTISASASGIVSIATAAFKSAGGGATTYNQTCSAAVTASAPVMLFMGLLLLSASNTALSSVVALKAKLVNAICSLAELASLATTPARLCAASVTLSPTMRRSMGKGFTSSSPPLASLVKRANITLWRIMQSKFSTLTANATPIGFRSIQVNKSASASMGNSASLFSHIPVIFTQMLIAGTASVASLQAIANLALRVMCNASAVRQIGKALQSLVICGASLQRLANKQFAAGISQGGIVVRLMNSRLAVATSTAFGVILLGTQSLARTLAAACASVGSQSTHRAYFRTLAASSAVSSVLRRQTGRLLRTVSAAIAMVAATGSNVVTFLVAYIMRMGGDDSYGGPNG